MAGNFANARVERVIREAGAFRVSLASSHDTTRPHPAHGKPDKSAIRRNPRYLFLTR